VCLYIQYTHTQLENLLQVQDLRQEAAPFVDTILGTPGCSVLPEIAIPFSIFTPAPYSGKSQIAVDQV